MINALTLWSRDGNTDIPEDEGGVHEPSIRPLHPDEPTERIHCALDAKQPWPRGKILLS